MFVFRFAFFLLFGLLLGTGSRAYAQDSTTGGVRPAQPYTTIQSVKVVPLSNGIQVRVAADGLLQYRYAGVPNYGQGTRSLALRFPQARNGLGKNFITVDRYPVSYISLTTPQDAVNGIGLNLTVNLLASATPQITFAPDGQGIIITIPSDRTVEGGRRSGGDSAGAPAVAPVDTTTAVEFQDGKLFLRTVKADIHGLIAAMAAKTGLSVAVDDTVERKVSLNLSGITPEAALQSIATANGLALSKIDGIFILSEGVPTDLATYRVSGTESYRMQYTQAETASGLLPNFLYSYVKVNPEQNAVVVTAPTQMLAKIGKDLDSVDVPSPQIVVEAVAVEFTDDVTQSLGLLLNNTRSTSVSTLDTNAGQITYNTIGALPQNFQLTLQALVQSGKARVRARPRMAVVNGKTATIFIGAQQFIQTQFNSYGQTQTRIQPVDVGVKLTITPLTGGNGEITTNLAPEVSNITEQDVQTGLPVLSTRNASTTVRVRDGETVVIGGLALDQEQSTANKIPLLGDIPLLGQVFRSHSRNHVQTELVVFVTPHIQNTAEGRQPASVSR